jgi:hypothetical protein
MEWLGCLSDLHFKSIRRLVMEIKIQIRGRVFSICFGRKTKWFQSVYWFMLEELWYHNNEVMDAKILKSFWREHAKSKTDWFLGDDMLEDDLGDDY